MAEDQAAPAVGAGRSIRFYLFGLVVIVGAFDSFVRLYEEPTLRETYGESPDVYRAAVPRWIPRFRR